MKKQVLLLFCMILAFSAFGQRIITGTVTNEQNEPLQAVSIAVMGSTVGATTDANGQFSISTFPNSTLRISYIGYVSQELKVVDEIPSTIVLSESFSDMEDVVVIGYQKVTRKKSTAAISSISAKELANLPAASFDQLLQGRLSGVNVQNFTGEPGVSPNVSVRGSSLISRGYDENRVVNVPLYVVDGVPQPTDNYVSASTGTGTNFLAGINPNDIESIDVLKDASAAAIYGSRAANGVIMITTKKGLSTEPQVNFTAYSGLTQRPQLRDVTLGTVERRQKMRILESQIPYVDQRNLPIMLTDSLNPAFNGNSDWQDMFYQIGLIKNADLSLSGSGNGSTYRFSAGYYDEQGVLKATGFKRYSMRLNLVSKALREKLMINPIIAYSRADRARGGGSVGLGAGTMPSSLFNLDPNKREYMLGAYDENLDVNINNQFTFNLNLMYPISDKVQVSSQNSYMLNNARRDNNQTNLLTSNRGNTSSSYSDNEVNLLSSNFLSYTDNFNKHNLSLVAGTDILFNQFQYTEASGQNGVSDQIQVVSGFQQKNLFARSDYQAYGLLSYYARVAYDFDSRYLFSFSSRYDGSSRFGANNKWGFFPAASAAWLISEENFMKDRGSVLSLLKLRGSYGTSGSLPSNNYLQYNLYNVNAASFFGNNNATSYNGESAITPNFYDGAAQKGLSWERSMQWNIGLDAELDNGKFALEFDVYNKESSLQLFSVILPVTTGYDLALTNSIGVRNSGAELAISANPLSRSSNLRWFSRLNISYNKNAIMNLPNSGRDLVMSGGRFDKSHILSVGSPINAFYLYRTLGVYATDEDVPVNPYTGDRFSSGSGNPFKAGDFHFQDLDQDYLIDPFNDGINPDKMVMGDPNPHFTGGWVNDFTYKNFTLGVFATFTFKRDILNLFEADQFSNSTAGDPTLNFAYYSTPNLNKVDIWRENGDQATYAKYDLGAYRYYYASSQSFFLEKGGYLRIKSVNVSYNLSGEKLSQRGIDRLRIFGIVDNLAMFQQSKKLPDAEAVNSYGEYSGTGYPIPKKITLGLEIQF